MNFIIKFVISFRQEPWPMSQSRIWWKSHGLPAADNRYDRSALLARWRQHFSPILKAQHRFETNGDSSS